MCARRCTNIYYADFSGAYSHLIYAAKADTDPVLFAGVDPKVQFAKAIGNFVRSNPQVRERVVSARMHHAINVHNVDSIRRL